MARVLVACEFSGIVRDAFAARGHDAWSCDIIPTESPGKHYEGRVQDIIPSWYVPLNPIRKTRSAPKWDLMIAHPPCTYLSVSGSRWLYNEDGSKNEERWKNREKALDFVQYLMDAPIERICVENPVSVISSQLRKPEQLIHPWESGHPAEKRTCLWLKNLPKLEPSNIVYDEMMELPKKERHRIWWMGSSKSKERSIFYPGIADAMAEQWGRLL